MGSLLLKVPSSWQIHLIERFLPLKNRKMQEIPFHGLELRQIYLFESF